MENTSAQQPTVAPSQPSSPPPSPAVSPPPVPSVDLKAPLKIDTEASEKEVVKNDYGKKLLILGIVFCIVIVLSSVVIAYFWIQNSNQTQKPVTVTQTK